VFPNLSNWVALISDRTPAAKAGALPEKVFSVAACNE
jgi:hypothetical protein